jgi:hypothetical protein
MRMLTEHGNKGVLKDRALVDQLGCCMKLNLRNDKKMFVLSFVLN